jgi:hypothetical protein
MGQQAYGSRDSIVFKLRRARERRGIVAAERHGCVGGLCLLAALAWSAWLAGTAGTAHAAGADQAQVHGRYDDTAKYAAIRTMLQTHKVMEKAVLFLSPLRLPRDLTVRTAECGAPLVPYDAGKGIITICYEAVASIEELAKGATSDADELAALVTGGVIEEVLHRMAAGVLEIYDLPVWGKEEDAADMLGAFLMLKFDERTAVVAISGAAKLFVFSTTALGKVDYTSEISPSAQRFYNYLCIAYGGEPLVFKPLVDNGALPEGRAARCGREYDQVRKAFDLRIMPHVDPDLAVKIRAMDWLTYDKQ